MTSHDGLCMFCELKPLVQHQDMTKEDLQLRPHLPRMGPEGGRIHPEVESAIHRARGGGQPLNGTLKEQMSTALRHDFNEVRVHTGPEADRLNRRLRARAFTVGTDIFFRRGKYDPTSLLGQELIAHELTHVVQQCTGRVRGSGSGMTVRPAGDAFELEANVLARQVAAAGNETRKVGKGPCAPGECVWGKHGLRILKQVMPAEKTVESRCPARIAPAIDKRFPVIQRSAASLANIARYHGKSGWTHNYRPTTCNEAVLGWLLKSMGKTHPWQLMRQICLTFILPATVGDWMYNHIYQHPVRLRRDHVTGAVALAPPLQLGDILFIEGMAIGSFLAHSMVVVQVPPHTLISGFNNHTTFTAPGLPVPFPPPAAYDPTPRDVTNGNLWNGPAAGPQTFSPTARPLFRVRYYDAMFALSAALVHWEYSWTRTPGWRHSAPAGGCLLASCPH